MSDAQANQDDEALTLDAPGAIAVVGGGALGVEAALYGRFLGYDGTLIEAEAIGHSMSDDRDESLSMLPDRCLSLLAKQALLAHFGDGTLDHLPTTFGEWIDNILVPLTQTDLFRGRVRMQTRVARIDTVSIEESGSVDDSDDSDDDESIEDVPPDFRLSLESSGVWPESSLDVEAVILAIGPTAELEVGFDLPAPYFHRIGEAVNQPEGGSAEENLVAGLQEIVSIFAGFAGRDQLDLYRPQRG
jgi:hypothetical protein